MADPSKTEPATPKRKREAREQGQIARSHEINTFLILLAFLFVIHYWANHLFFTFQALYTHYLGHLYLYPWTLKLATSNLTFFVSQFVFLLLPIFVAVAIGGLVAGMGQAGLHVTFKPITPKFTKINPVNGFQRILSKQGFVELIRSTIKIVVVGWVAYGVISKRFGLLVPLSDGDLKQSVFVVGEIVYQLILRVLIVLAIIAILDFFYQRYQFEQNLKMTKQEVKDEMKQTEGDPRTRSRIRAKQRQMAMRRMMQEVPKAVVVVTNPVHLAVALQYEETMAAPRVVAKGAGFIAERIKEIAREHKIVIVEKPPLARLLFKTAEIGKFIPPELYRAVAEIIAYVYQITKSMPNKAQVKEG